MLPKENPAAVDDVAADVDDVPTDGALEETLAVSETFVCDDEETAPKANPALVDDFSAGLSDVVAEVVAPKLNPAPVAPAFGVFRAVDAVAEAVVDAGAVVAAAVEPKANPPEVTRLDDEATAPGGEGSVADFFFSASFLASSSAFFIWSAVSINHKQ